MARRPGPPLFNKRYCGNTNKKEVHDLDNEKTQCQIDEIIAAGHARTFDPDTPHKEKKRFAERLKQIWLQPDKQSALSVASLLIQDYEKRFPEAVKCLEDGLEDSLQFYEFPEIDKRRISSTNIVERIIREIRRRSRVIGVFPMAKLRTKFDMTSIFI